ncbi:MAG TPA: histidine phosphatase family protein [Bacillota bacterium]|nr:histidine phosphatase family protein [Bacillota bacterium]
MENGKIVGLILAAGYSSRMGAFKPLLQIGDMTAVEQVSSALKNAGITRIIGVTGFQRERLSSVFASEGILEAYNPDFDRGMFTSIKAGIAKAMEGCPAEGGAAPEGFFLMLVDSPLIPAEVLRLILREHEKDPSAFIVPCFRGKKGHPLFIPAQYGSEILAYDGEGGLKAITNRYEDRLIRLEVGTESVVLDMDTQEGYREILEYYESRLKRARDPAGRQTDGEGAGAGFEEELRGRRLFFVRHGEIRQHKEKIFLGQTDIPLSEKGREQAAFAAEELKRYGVSANRIYASDLSRAMETAEIIRDQLGRDSGVRGKDDSRGVGAEMAVVPEPRFREMALGEWDGRYISEIREKYPEEYRKRGENLLTYKYGNGSENFYDLQYRVIKGFQGILKAEREAKDKSGDIVIVSHSGVIGVLLSNLRRTELAEELKGRIPNGGVAVLDFTKEN